MPEPRRGSEWRTRLLSQEIIVAEADGRLLGFTSLAQYGRKGSELTIDTLREHSKNALQFVR